MITKDTGDIQVEQSSTEPSSHVDAKMKSISRSNAHDFKSPSMAKNTLSMIRKNRRTRNMSITYDISTAHKIRIMKYTVCLLFL
jgi:hypothetical protein